MNKEQIKVLAESIIIACSLSSVPKVHNIEGLAKAILSELKEDELYNPQQLIWEQKNRKEKEK